MLMDLPKKLINLTTQSSSGSHTKNSLHMRPIQKLIHLVLLTSILRLSEIRTTTRTDPRTLLRKIVIPLLVHLAHTRPHHTTRYGRYLPLSFVSRRARSSPPRFRLLPVSSVFGLAPMFKLRIGRIIIAPIVSRGIPDRFLLFGGEERSFVARGGGDFRQGGELAMLLFGQRGVFGGLLPSQIVMQVCLLGLFVAILTRRRGRGRMTRCRGANAVEARSVIVGIYTVGAM